MMRLFLGFFAFSVAVSSLMGSKYANAGENMLMVVKPFARATAGKAKNGVAFLTVNNRSDNDDFLIGAETPAARNPMLHTHVHNNGIMRMRHVAAIKVPARGSVVLKPGGNHVMLMGLVAPMMAGETLPLVLIFKHAGRITIDVPIGSVGAAAPAHSGHHMKPMKKK